MLFQSKSFHYIEKVLLFILIMSFSSCEGLADKFSSEVINVTGITVTPEESILTVGDTAQISSIISPENATFPEVTWTTSDTAIVTVDTNGKVTALTAGAATITVTTEDGNFSAESKITVVRATIPVTGVSVTPPTKNLTEGDSAQFTAAISPSDATNTNVSWTTSNSAIVTVDTNGKVTALTAGSATIIVTTEDGDFMAESIITVNESQADLCIVSLNTMGGSTLDEISAQVNDLLNEPIEPTKANFIFDGWYKSDYYYEEWDFDNDRVIDDMILYARWTETFDSSGKPTLDSTALTYNEDSSKTYKVQEPWNYYKTYNADREYPLVIALHGWTSLLNHYYAPVILNDDEEAQEYPCFYLAPNHGGYGSWSETDGDIQWIRDLIEELISEYRIDTNRIYIIGFSMGGSGSYYFAEELYADKGLMTAGIIRCAGASNSDLPEEMAKKIGVWYNYGLSDSSDILTVAENAFDFIKGLSCYTDASETIVEDTMGGYDRTTSILNMDGIEFFRFSQYTGMGHSSTPVWQDPDLLKWLFYQSLEKW